MTIKDWIYLGITVARYIIALIAELEDKFDIEITMEEKTEENFENVDTLVEMIERLQ